jgi:hypothetical protein
MGKRAEQKHEEQSVAIGVDTLLERDETYPLLEILCEMFPQATIYTYAYNVNQLVGHVQHHRIRSSSMTRWCHSLRDWQRWRWMTSVMKRTLKIDPQTDLFISLTKGSIQQLDCPEKTKHLSLVLDHYRPGPSSLGQYLFSSLNKKDDEQSWKRIHRFCFLHSQLKKEWTQQLKVDAPLIPPFIPIQEFLHCPFPQNSDGRKHVVISVEAIGESFLKDFLIFLEAQSSECTFHLVGLVPYSWFQQQYAHPDWTIPRFLDQQGRVSFPTIKYWGSICDGELVYLLRESSFVIDLSPKTPRFCLKALAVGRPIISLNHSVISDWIDQKCGFFMTSSLTFMQKEMEKVFSQMQNEYTWFDPQLLRSVAMKYHDAYFRRFVREQIRLVSLS